MRGLILAVVCGVLVALPALAQQSQAEPNPLESIGNAVRGFFNRIFGSEESKPQETSPAEAAPAETPKPQPEAAQPPPPTAAFKGSPMKRAKLRGLKRNAGVVLGNIGDPATVTALVAALSDDEPLVRGHAAWALGKIGSP